MRQPYRSARKLPSEILLIASNASRAVSNARNADNFTILLNRLRSVTDFSTCGKKVPISSNSVTSKRVYPTACSNSTYNIYEKKQEQLTAYLDRNDSNIRNRRVKMTKLHVWKHELRCYYFNVKHELVYLERNVEGFAVLTMIQDEFQSLRNIFNTFSILYSHYKHVRITLFWGGLHALKTPWRHYNTQHELKNENRWVENCLLTSRVLLP